MNNKEILSQQEIDALLRQVEENASLGEPDPVSLSDAERAAVGEVANLSFGKAAAALAALLRQNVEIASAVVDVVPHGQLFDGAEPVVAVRTAYTQGLEGSSLLWIRRRDAGVIADIMLGGDGTNPPDALNELHISAVSEAVHKMLDAADESMAALFGAEIRHALPEVGDTDFRSGEDRERLLPEVPVWVRVTCRLVIGTLADSPIWLFLPLPLARNMVSLLLQRAKSGEMAVPSADTANRQSAGETRGVPPGPGFGKTPGSGKPQAARVQAVEFANLEKTPTVQATSNINLLLDISLSVTVELGRTRKMIREILQLTPGSIIELDRLAGEPVDILVNNKLIAKGEVVVIDENFGVRVTDIIAPDERLKNLQ